MEVADADANADTTTTNDPAGHHRLQAVKSRLNGRFDSLIDNHAAVLWPQD